MSSTSPPVHQENGTDEELLTLVQALLQDPEREPVASEIEVLRSIYGEDALKLWRQSGSQYTRASASNSKVEAIRYTIELNLLPPHEDITVKVLVSLPPTYPSTSPPQLQLLSRYVGAFGADAELFGTILRTFISVTGIPWTANTVCVFDGLQSVAEKITAWYQDRLSVGKVGELQREFSKEGSDTAVESLEELPPVLTEHKQSYEEAAPAVFFEDTPSFVVERQSLKKAPSATSGVLPEDVEIFVAEPIIDRKSVFVGRACRISYPSQVPLILSHLLADKHIARAAHPTINAWRCQVGPVLHQDNDDDGESAAGGRLAHLLQILEVNNVLVIVTRHFGGIHLGPDRFKHINQAARNALDVGGFLEAPETAKKQGRGRKH